MYFILMVTVAKKNTSKGYADPKEENNILDYTT